MVGRKEANCLGGAGMGGRQLTECCAAEQLRYSQPDLD